MCFNVQCKRKKVLRGSCNWTTVQTHGPSSHSEFLISLTGASSSDGQCFCMKFIYEVDVFCATVIHNIWQHVEGGS